MYRSIKFAPFLLSVLVWGLTPASADIIGVPHTDETESNDTLATADFARNGVNYGTVGDGTGNRATIDDPDIWTFDLTEGVNFSAIITPGPADEFTALFSPVMVLLEETTFDFAPGLLFGTSVKADQLVGSFTFLPTETGRYYLIVTASSYIPIGIAGELLTDPTALGGIFNDEYSSQALTSWDYLLTLDGVSALIPPVTFPETVPVPGTLLLLLFGMPMVNAFRAKF